MTGDGVDAVIAAMDGLPADAAEVRDAVLVSRMQRLVALRAMVDAALVEQLAAFDARAGARYDGQTSTRAWLRSRLRLGGQAGDLLRTARQLGGLPEVSKAFAAGEITLEHAAVIAHLAGEVGAAPLAEYEQILLELARQAPPAKLRVACEHLRQLLDPDGDADEAVRQRRRRYLAAGRTVDGMVHLQGLLDATGGDVVLAALRAAMPVPAEYEERTPAQRRADALVDICAAWLASGEAPTIGGLRPQLQVTVSLNSLRSRSPSAWTTSGFRARRSRASRSLASRAWLRGSPSGSLVSRAKARSSRVSGSLASRAWVRGCRASGSPLSRGWARGSRASRSLARGARARPSLASRA